MHKKLYALLFFFMFPFMAYADVPIDEAHFPDPAFRSFISLNLDKGWFDTNGDFKGFEDGILSDSEISKIERIESGGFKSLKGIKYFYAIKELGLNSYEIEVDVSGLTALEILHVAQPTKLNASGCTALKELRCDARYLTKLDISGCTALETLRCDVSAKGLLTELDVSSCTALKYLSCGGNELTSLDLRNNPALEYLSCGGNELTSLDLRGNYVLKELYCGYNRLTDLDLSNNPSLEILNFESNCLTELDVSNNTALRSIGCLDQTRRTLNFSKTSEGYEVCLKDYVSHLENIDVDSVGASDNKLLSYDKQAGVAVFGLPVTKLRYNYNLHFKNINSVENVCMPVTITNPLIITAIGRSKSGLITNTIICNIADDSYLDLRGEPITEYSINPYVYDYRDCENTGFAADGNSRLILTVLADKPGIAYFSFDDSIGAKLESLARTELSAQDQLSTTRMSYGNQVSAVLVAPESFPVDKNFPSDTFKVHVKFTDEDGEIKEDDLELKLEAAPVLLIPGMFNPGGFTNVFAAASLLASAVNPGDSQHTFGLIQQELLSRGFKKEHIAFWNHGGRKGIKNLIGHDYNHLFTILANMFESYAKEGIVCTKADVIAHGMGGLIVREFLNEANKSDADDANNWSARSYKQGMIHRVINIAVPHMGTPLANVLLGDFSVLGNVAIGNDALAQTCLWLLHNKYLKIYPEPFLKEIAVGSDFLNNLPLPANVPMHFVYGDVKGYLDSFENIKDNAFMLFDLAKFVKSAGKNIAKYQKLTEYSDFVLFNNWVQNSNPRNSLELLQTINRLDDRILLRVASQQEAIIRDIMTNNEIRSVALSFAEMAYQNPQVTGFFQILGVLSDGLEALNPVTLPFNLYFAMQRVIFSGQAHDMFVPVDSAVTMLSEYSTGFPEPGTNSWMDWRFRHSTLCQQGDVAYAVVTILLRNDMNDFAILKKSVQLTDALPQQVKANSTVYGELNLEGIDLENLCATNFVLTANQSTIMIPDMGTSVVKFTASAKAFVSNDVQLVIHKDGLDRTFPMYTDDGKSFEINIEFTSSDSGVMFAYCYTPNDKKLYVSNTFQFSCIRNLDNVDITEISFFGKDMLYTNVNSDIPAGLYAVDSDGRYYDISSPLAGTQWTSTEIARVNDNGCIYGLKEGSTTLTATFRGFTASINVEVLSSEEAMSEETPQIITQTLPNAIKGVSYRVGLGATGGGIIWSAKGLPAGLNIINGEIIGIPEEQGTFDVEITASNSVGSVSAMFTLIVQASGTATVIDSYHFRDANLRQLILENFDTDGDGVLSIEEIDNVHSLEVNGKGITSLEGLEIFTNIEYIDCSYNNLTSLDVSPFLALKWLVCTNNSLTLLDLSENKLLINLDCTGNFIHTLDVSDNVELEELYCWSNDIHTLILGDNPKLTVIHCHDNPLGELDVTGCSGLLRLYCWNCGLETIDLSKCEQLISLDIAVNRIESLDVSNNRLMKSLCVNENPLKSIDLSNNTALVDLLLWSTDLEALDLRNCPNLELLHCHDSNLITLTVGSHPNLRELNCNNNQITLLNVSGCPALEILYCYDNEITSMVMGNNTALRDFHCDNNQISLLDVSNCPSLEYLYCPDNQITLLTMGSHAKLRELSCVNNQIKGLDVSGCSALEVLACINNQLTSLDVSVCKKLERLYCNNNYIEVLNLVENTELVTLDCSVNNLVSLNIDNCGKLLWLYCNDNSLTRLNIGGCPEFVEFVHDEFTEIVNHHSTDGDNSGESSDEDTPVKSDDQAPIVIDAPAVDLQNPTVKETIINALQAQNPTLNFTIGNDVEILMLPEKFTGIERTIDDVSSEELAAIPESEDVAVVFPIIVVEQDGVYIWGVQLDNLKVGTLIKLYLLRKDSTTVSSAFQTSGYAQDTYIFLDDDGIEINTVPANKHVNIVAFMEAGKTYAPILTQSGLVSDTPDASPDTESDTPSIEPKNNAIGSQGGGCSAVGFSVFVAFAFLLRKKR